MYLLFQFSPGRLRAEVYPEEHGGRFTPCVKLAMFSYKPRRHSLTTYLQIIIDTKFYKCDTIYV